MDDTQTGVRVKTSKSRTTGRQDGVCTRLDFKFKWGGGVREETKEFS